MEIKKIELVHLLMSFIMVLLLLFSLILRSGDMVITPNRYGVPTKYSYEFYYKASELSIIFFIVGLITLLPNVYNLIDKQKVNENANKITVFGNILIIILISVSLNALLEELSGRREIELLAIGKTIIFTQILAIIINLIIIIKVILFDFAKIKFKNREQHSKTNMSIYQDLKELKNLFDRGIITEDEYNKKKDHFLEKL